MTTMPIPLDAGRATCADPVHLPLVDAAFDKPGGPEAQEMKSALCRTCPVVETCFAWGMTHAEGGVWAGLTPAARTRRGAPRGLTLVTHVRTDGVPAQAWRRKSNGVRGADTKPRTPNAGATRCAELGIREADVKRWALEQGLASTIRGRVSLAHVEAWAAAHPQAS